VPHYFLCKKKNANKQTNIKYRLSGRPPFEEKKSMSIFDQIKNAHIYFDDKIWEKNSRLAKNIIKRMMDVDPRTRISAKDALDHPWLTVEFNLFFFPLLIYIFFFLNG
jgi:serine/threonine protein kinase